MSNGVNFPYTPYNRVAHVCGLNFVGTDVMIDEKVVDVWLALAEEHSIEEALRFFAVQGKSFLAVDAVTYRRS